MTSDKASIRKDRVPFAAFVLGAGGLIPFVAGAVLPVVGPTEWGDVANRIVLGYGAVILSFLGGILWGRVMNGVTAPLEDERSRLLTLSILPSLLAWAALLIDPRSGLVLLAVSFVGMLAVDLWLGRRGVAPQWFPHLRAPLTIVVVGCLTVGLLA